MFDRRSVVGAALDAPAAREVLERFLPGIAASPMAIQFRSERLGALVAFAPGLRDDSEAEALFWDALSGVPASGEHVPDYAPAVEPASDFEPRSVVCASAALKLPGPTPQWGVVEVVLNGPSHGNPFVDVELSATFRRGDASRQVGGFYDGNGRFVLRLLAEEEGEWRFVTTSNARSLDGIAGTVTITPPMGISHGPVRVDGFHFRYADGTRHTPIGTTAYAWTHQPDELQERTIATLAASSFTKLRMCVFPKSYLYNSNDPERFPFVRGDDRTFDFTRFDVEYFRQLERRIQQLGNLGIEADLILFHAYDRWGFADLGPAVDERYVRYVVRRLAAFANVWWSIANEYDLVWSKTRDDWDRLGTLVAQSDPHRHLLSIHNGARFYDYSREWITHCSLQRIDLYRTAEYTDEWRMRWAKPIVIDECGYEGDIDQGWGNLTGEELVRRFWEAGVRGGYLGHGETYLNADDELWWSKGGELIGTSPARIALLQAILAESPTGVLDPLPSDWDAPWGGVAGQYQVGYFGLMRPTFRSIVLPSGDFAIDVIDTWNMTIDRLPGVHTGTVRVELPARQYMAIRLVRA